MGFKSELSCPLKEQTCPLNTVAARQVVGWREWVSLPGLNVSKIKAKIDTGALTSAIHAFDIQPCMDGGKEYVDFILHPLQDDEEDTIPCRAAVIDRRKVTSSTGHSEERYTIETVLRAGTGSWPIELTLTNRDEMGFRMLLGRQALRERLIVDPAQSFCLS